MQWSADTTDYVSWFRDFAREIFRVLTDDSSFILNIGGSTDEGDLVLDPFAGSNTTGAVAEALPLRWIAVDNVPEYLESSRFRFFEWAGT